MKMNKLLLLFLTVVLSHVAVSQISSAVVTFERRVNLYKKYKNTEHIKSIKEDEKIKIDYFSLIFTDTCSLFKPIESQLKEVNSWATTKNTVFQNFRTNKRVSFKTILKEDVQIIDSLYLRNWKFTESTRSIAGYTCRKVVWQANDSTKIYAWYSYDLGISTGPESFCGLPGTILGVATEDGSVVYFAKKVEVVKPQESQFNVPDLKKHYLTSELKLIIDGKNDADKLNKIFAYENVYIW